MTYYRPPAYTIAAAIVAGLLSAALQAQGPTPTLDDLRRKSELAQPDLNLIERYFDDQTARLKTGLTRLKERTKFRARIIDDYRHTQNSVRFRSAFAARCSSRVLAELKTAQPMLSRVLIGTLSDMANPQALPALLEAMKSSDEATRALATAGIRDMSQEIQADSTRVSMVLNALTEAGRRETSRIVLYTIFESFNFQDKKTEQAQAILSILESRLAVFAKGDLPGQDAEERAFLWFVDSVDSLSDAEKVRMVKVQAQFLVRYAHKFLYANVSEPSRRVLQQLVHACEIVLAKLTNRADDTPTLSSAMGMVSEDRAQRIIAALASWVGLGETNGILNAAPWQVPKGGGVADLKFDLPGANQDGDDASPPSSP